MERLIITAAVTGSFDTRKQLNLPITPQEIAQAAVECIRRGLDRSCACEKSKTRKPSMELSIIERCRNVRSRCDMIVNLTAGLVEGVFSEEDKELAGEAAIPHGRRIHMWYELKPEMCFLDVGTISFHGGYLPTSYPMWSRWRGHPQGGPSPIGNLGRCHIDIADI